MPLPFAPGDVDRPAGVDRQRDAGQHGAPPAPDRERPRLEQHRHPGHANNARRARSAGNPATQPLAVLVRHRGMAPIRIALAARVHGPHRRRRRVRRRRRPAVVAAAAVPGAGNGPAAATARGHVAALVTSNRTQPPGTASQLLRLNPADGSVLSSTGVDLGDARDRAVRERRDRRRRHVDRAVRDDRRPEPGAGGHDVGGERRARPAHALRHPEPERHRARGQRPRRRRAVDARPALAADLPAPQGDDHTRPRPHDQRQLERARRHGGAEPGRPAARRVGGPPRGLRPPPRDERLVGRGPHARPGRPVQPPGRDGLDRPDARRLEVPARERGRVERARGRQLHHRGARATGSAPGGRSRRSARRAPGASSARRACGSP